jgi:hypothetical protein
MKRLLYILMIATVGLTACNKSINPQQETTSVQESVSSQQYTFTATSASPLGGRNIQLTSGYNLEVGQHSVVATLPYYGRAYTAPVDPNYGGVRFNSKRFRYTATQDAKGSWDILIVPEDVPDVQQLRLNITTDGYATLYVTNTNRQAISYNGYVSKNKVATAE